METIATIAMILLVLTGLGFECIRFVKGEDVLTDPVQLEFAIKRDRIASVCFLLGALSALAARYWLVAVFIVLFGVLMNDSSRRLKGKADLVEREHEKNQGDTTELGHSPTLAPDVDPDILAEIERSMNHRADPSAQPADAYTQAEWRRRARAAEHTFKDKER